MVTKKKGTLFLIPVPLLAGKPHDFLPAAAIQAILSLRVFIVEDIRSARRFLRAVGYTGDFGAVIFHVLNEHTRPEELSDMLNDMYNGIDTGLLSETGAPCVADPGNLVVAAAHRHEIKVIPLTGPSSLLLALMASGFNGQHFVFHGYLPVKNPGRINKIKEIEAEAYRRDQTQIFIETPYRNDNLLQSLVHTCREQTLLCVACNLGSHNELIISKPMLWWKSNQPDIHKKPAVFLLYR